MATSVKENPPHAMTKASGIDMQNELTIAIILKTMLLAMRHIYIYIYIYILRNVEYKISCMQSSSDSQAH